MHSTSPPNIILAVETTLPGLAPNNPCDIASAFGIERWLAVDGKGTWGSLADVGTSGMNSHAHLQEKVMPLAQLYQELFRQLPNDCSILRVRNFHYPLTNLFILEMEQQYPVETCDYALYTADEVLPDNFFLERISPAAMRQISAMPVPLMPPGYFNGSILPGAGRIFASEEVSQFYLEEHFETVLPGPRQLTIDIMPLCNYACLKCHYHSPLLPASHSQGSGIKRVKPGAPMSLPMLEEVLQRAQQYEQLRNIHLYMSGEPLMHPHIGEMVQMVLARGFVPAFASNGTLLTKSMAERLLDAGISYIGFSIDSLDPARYQHLLGGDLRMVEKNIMRWQELCLKRTGSFMGSIMCVLNEENLHEAEDFYNTWTSRGFTVLFNYQIDVLTRRILLQNSEHDSTQKAHCTSPLYMYLDSQANVLVCAAQLNGSTLSAPNFLKMSPQDIWRSPYLQDARHRLLAGQRLDFCQKCSGSCVMNNATWIHEAGRTISKSNAGWYGAPPVHWQTLSDWMRA